MQYHFEVQSVQVQEVAIDIGVTPDTVRYYTRIGLLDPVKNVGNGYREYGERDRRRLRFILSARQLGFSVADINQILDHADQGESPCQLVRTLIEKRLDEVTKRFNDTAKLRERMEAALESWESTPDRTPTGDMICHLIESFSDGSE